jgi:diguanylate cyclase (GGDEF)-like protein
MKEEAAGTDNIVKSTARTVTTSVLVFVIGLYLLAAAMNQNSQFTKISLDSKNAVYTITRTDGSTETYYQNHFALVHYGEKLTVDIDPLKDVGDIQNGTLVFSVYHCYVTVYCGDKVIYQQTEPEKGKIIGHRYYIVPLPDGYENETIRIEAVCSENDSFNSLIYPKIIPADCATYAFRNGPFATGILLLTLLIISIFMELTSFITWIREKHSDGMVPIALLCSSVCLWYMGFAGYMQPFVESTKFLAVAEYVGLYLSPIALSYFIQTNTTSTKLHKFCKVVTLLLSIFFIFASIMTIFAEGISYVDYVDILRVLFLFVLIILLFAEIKERKVERDIAEKTLHFGMTITIGIGAVELMRFILSQYFAKTITWLSNSIMPLCILSLVFTSLMYYGVQITMNQYHRIEQENLRRLAFIDQLTGAPNRAACLQRLEEMKKEKITDYVVTFIDINFLKKTNDTWGHDKGDELIQTASDLLKKHFVNDDFFGRWGGDEFVAVHFGTLDETRVIMETIQKEIDEVNASGRYDFTLSEAWGFGQSTKDAPLTPEEAISRADEQMYADKQKAHAARE